MRSRAGLLVLAAVLVLTSCLSPGGADGSTAYQDFGYPSAGFLSSDDRVHKLEETMSKGFVKQSAPFIVPTDDGKLIEEHFGLASVGDGKISIAHMIAPAGWAEPPQTPEFDEYILMVSGRKIISIDGQEIELAAGDSLLVESGHRVCYSNPFSEPAEYWSVCRPAFSLDLVNREV